MATGRPVHEPMSTGGWDAKQGNTRAMHRGGVTWEHGGWFLVDLEIGVYGMCFMCYVGRGSIRRKAKGGVPVRFTNHGCPICDEQI